MKNNRLSKFIGYRNNKLVEKEIGGTVYNKNSYLSFVKYDNLTHSKNQFISYIDKDEFHNENFAGLWHTHPGRSFPSPQDIFQLLKVNVLFRKNFLMIIFGRKSYSIVKFKFLVFPKITFKLYGSEFFNPEKEFPLTLSPEYFK